jgi:RHS repeat-associated protein
MQRFVGASSSTCVDGSGRSRPIGTLRALCLAAVGLALVAPGASAHSGPEAKGQHTARAAQTPAAPGPELELLRTRTSRTFQDKDTGKLVARLYGGSVNFRDEGRWRAISNRLVPSQAEGYAVTNQANAFRVLFPSDLGGAPIRISRGEHWVETKLDGAAGPGRFDGDEATYPDVLPGVLARYRVGNDTVKEDLVFSDARTPTVTMGLSVSAGLTPRLHKDTVELLDADRRVQMRFARPFLFTSDGAEAARSRLTTTLSKSGSAYRLRFAIDEAWLAEAVKAGPVTLDPFVATTATNDCLLDSEHPNTSFCGDTNFGTGYRGTAHDHMGLVRFDIRNAVPAGATVFSARLRAYVNYAENGNTQTIGAFRMTTPWTDGATWTTKDGAAGWSDPSGPVAGGDYATDPIASEPLAQADAGTWKGWYVTSYVRGVLGRDFEDRGLGLRSQTQSNVNWFSLAATESGSGAPYLEVNYSPGVGRKPFWTFAAQTQLSDRDALSVNVGSGNLLVESTDMSIPGTGISNEITRVYNSLPYDSYSALGNVWKTSVGSEWHLWRDGGDEWTLMDATGATWTFARAAGNTFRAKGLKATLTENADLTVDLLYDASRTKLRFATDRGGAGRALDWIEDRNANRITYHHNTAGHTTSITDTQGRTATVAAVHNGSLFDTFTDHTSRSGYWDFNSSEQIESYTDPDGKQMQFTYASNVYGANDDLTQIVDFAGNKTVIGYDGQHRVTSITRVTNPTTGAGDTTTFAYAQTIDDPCNPSAHIGKTIVTDPNGKATTYCYDAQLRVTKSKDPAGQVRDTAYDTQSNVTSIQSTASSTSTLGFNATYAFNTDGVLETLDQGSGSPNKLTTRFAYNPATNGGRFQPADTTSPQGNKTLFDYDTKGNLTSSQQTNTSGPKTQLAYGTAGKGSPTSSTDPDGNTTTYGYDTAGNLETITPPSGSGIGATTITYDALSRVKTVKDGKNQTRTYDYDLRDRIKKITFADGSFTSYTYDGNGFVLSRGDDPATGLLGVTTLLPDAKGRLKKETRPNGQITEYTYDGADNLKTHIDAGGTTTYGYGPTNLLTSVQEPGLSTTSTYEYNGDGNRTKAVLANNVTVLTPYDEAGRLQSLKTTNAANQVLQDTVYDYLKAGNDTALLQKLTDRTPTGADDVTTYVYDDLDRLDTAITAGSNPSSYNYDLSPGGRRTQEVRQDPGAASPTITTYGYNAGNQLTSINGSTANLAYDLNGNQTQSPSFGTLTVNARDQITGITPPGGTFATMVHAGPGQNDLVSQAGATLQNDALGLAAKTAGSTTTRYIRTPDGNPVSQTAGSTRRYFLTDERGSIVGLTDTGGARTDSYKYDPYGRTLGTPHDTLGYAGGIRAPGGLVHFEARYYNPTYGRWTQRDPINQAADLRQASAYSYAGGDPINLTDASGRSIFDDAVRGLRNGFSALRRGAEVGVGNAATGAVIGARFGGFGGAGLGAAGGFVEGFAVGSVAQTARNAGYGRLGDDIEDAGSIGGVARDIDTACQATRIC